MNNATVATLSATRGAYRLTYAHFRALDHALLHGNLDAARQAFSNLQEDAPDLAEIVHAAPLSEDSPRRTRLKRLAQALQNGDLEAAQTAFIQFQENVMADSHQPFPVQSPSFRFADH